MSETKANILLVDDDRDLLKLISLRLTAAGYAVQTAESGEQALARLAVSRPQVVITDLRMEGMDGMALFERIHSGMPTLPVIILTAHGTIPDAVAATRRGVFGFLTKPFDGKDLLAQVEQALKLTGGAPASGEPEAWRSGIVTCSQRMEEVLRQARLVAAARGVRFERKLPPVLVEGDADKLRVVVDNLITNALKFSPREGLVHVNLAKHDGQAILEVIDEGPGVAKEERSHIFEPFFRGTRARRGTVKGSGLGLAIAKEYVLAHRGRIDVIDGKGRGAHFRVSLPQTWEKKTT